MTWRPNATLASRTQSANLRRCIRRWMDDQAILEVCTPTLSHHATTDPHVPSVCTDDGRFLQTSPEFPMKRLLAADAEQGGPQPDLYQIAQVFRAGESGRFHNTEFSLLEWYRLGMDHRDLIGDVEELLRSVWQTFDRPWPGLTLRFYGEEVHKKLGQWPEDASVESIQAYFDQADRSFPASIANDINAALDLFIDEFVLPDFPANQFIAFLDYPVEQAALARIGVDETGRPVAERFEIFYGRVELANGFHELSHAAEQHDRFKKDLTLRETMGLRKLPLDIHLIDALEAGLPDCAGAALGLDRLQMVLGNYSHISEVLNFNDQRA